MWRKQRKWNMSVFGNRYTRDNDKILLYMTHLIKDMIIYDWFSYKCRGNTLWSIHKHTFMHWLDKSSGTLFCLYTCLIKWPWNWGIEGYLFGVKSGQCKIWYCNTTIIIQGMAQQFAPGGSKAAITMAIPLQWTTITPNFNAKISSHTRNTAKYLTYHYSPNVEDIAWYMCL